MNNKRKYLSILSLVLGITLTSCGSDFTYYRVRFDSLGGSAVETQRIMEGNPVVRPDTPTRDDYAFTGWYTTNPPTSETQWNFEIDRVMESFTLYAGWTLIEELEPTASLEYALEEGTYVVTGVGDDSNIVIPETYNDVAVTAIGENAFARKGITRVVIPDSITEIRLNAFHNCAQLESVEISENSALVSIANNAFSGNSSLKEFYIPKDLVTLGDSVFNNCGAITSFEVASENEQFEALEGHLVNKTTHSIIRGANNSIIPEGIVAIENAAFRRTEASTISIPSTVTTIGNYAFDDSDSLEAIEVSDTNANYSSLSGIVYDKSQENILIIPGGLRGDIALSSALTELPMNAFSDNTNLTSVFIPRGSLARIRSFAFRGTTLTIKYEGSESEWNEITKDSYWGSDDLEVTFNSEYTEPVGKTLIVYFSRTGNTETVAGIINEEIESDVVAITPRTPYVENYTQLLAVASQELSDNARPEISETTLNAIHMSDYSKVFIGYPIWHGYEPMIIRTFVDTYQGMDGKDIYLFSTSSSSQGSSSFSSITALCPNANVAGTLHLNSSGVSNASTRVPTWLESLNLI